MLGKEQRELFDLFRFGLDEGASKGTGREIERGRCESELRYARYYGEITSARKDHALRECGEGMQ